MTSSSERRPLIAGNWKLHKTLAEARDLAKDVAAGCADLVDVDVAVAPVATALSDVAAVLDGSRVSLAAQTTHHENSGAFTGELSPALIADAGCTHCIVGHSERRQMFGETDAGVRAKVAALLGEGLVPIVCIGETLEQRDAGQTLDVVRAQVSAAIEGIDDLGPTVFAYEPIWAIGTGRTAAAEDAQAVHAGIRDMLSQARGAALAQSIRILYGGSVKPANAAELLAMPDIDGALVGGASLSAESFVAIARAGSRNTAQ